MQNIQNDQARLRSILALASHHPEVRVHNGTGWDKLPVRFVVRLVERGEYEWEGTARRVRKIRALRLRPELPWRRCHRTTESATLLPSIEWLQEMYPVRP